MCDDKVGTAQIPPAGAQGRNEPGVDLARRRALVQAGWAVPAILAVGLIPYKAKAIGNYGTAAPTVDAFTDPSEAERALIQCQLTPGTPSEPPPDCFFSTTRAIVDEEPITVFLVIDP